MQFFKAFITLSLFIAISSGFMYLSAQESTVGQIIRPLSNESPVSLVVRRAAFDFGSGSVRLQIADVDITENRIVQTLFADKVMVELSQSLAHSEDGSFDSAAQKKALKAIETLLQLAEKYHPTEFAGIATEAFRLSKNGQELIDTIQQKLGVSLKIISQEEEGIIGFATAVTVAQADPEKAIVWDIGGGSLQIVAKSEDGYEIYKEHLGKVPMKNYIISELQHKSIDDVNSPNPISAEHAQEAIQHIQKSTEQLPQRILEKLNDPETLVLGIGAHPGAVRSMTKPYTSNDAYNKIFTMVNLSDDQIQNIYPTRPEFVISDLILVYGTMLATGIEKVQYVETSGNTSGVLITPFYWEGI